MKTRRAQRRYYSVRLSTPNKRDPSDQTLVQEARRRVVECVVHASLPIQKDKTLFEEASRPAPARPPRSTKHANVAAPSKVDHGCPLSNSARETRPTELA